MEHEQWDAYADSYHRFIISPLQEDVQNPLFSEIDRLSAGDARVVIDLGTGIGDLLPRLATRFPVVHAVDFSEKMLETAKQRHGEYQNISFWQSDMRLLTTLGITADVIIAVNSVLMPSFGEVNTALVEINATLRKGGIFIGIFPSMESVLYNCMLVYEREYQKYGEEKQALRSTWRIVEKRKYNFITCVYEDGEERQKFYYEFELRHRLEAAGFKDIKITKVLYPWGERSGDYEDFFGMPEMWDWYVTATK